jgi:hypothetical protein
VSHVMNNTRNMLLDDAGRSLTYPLTGTQKQKGIITYGLAADRQNPFAGAGNDAIFNTWRRFSGSVLYWLPPIVAGYYLMEWANNRSAVPAFRSRCFPGSLIVLSTIFT